MTAAILVALAQGASPGPVPVLTVLPPTEVRVAPGSSSEAEIVVTVRPGFHIQANSAAEPYLVPARLEIKKDDRVRLEGPAYPPAKPHRLRGADSDLLTYDGTFRIKLILHAESTTGSPADAFVLEGRFHYQACDDRICLRPASVPVRLPVRIAPETPPEDR